MNYRTNLKILSTLWIQRYKKKQYFTTQQRIWQNAYYQLVYQTNDITCRDYLFY